VRVQKGREQLVFAQLKRRDQQVGGSRAAKKKEKREGRVLWGVPGVSAYWGNKKKRPLNAGQEKQVGNRGEGKSPHKRPDFPEKRGKERRNQKGGFKGSDQR